jgi:beta-phosphoglucomutase-like phosphatase (HAD superfamily)
MKRFGLVIFDCDGVLVDSEVIAELLGHEVPANFAQQYHVRTALALKSELKGVPGIESALAEIRLPYRVASNGSHEKMQITLGITGR